VLQPGRDPKQDGIARARIGNIGHDLTGRGISYLEHSTGKRCGAQIDADRGHTEVPHIVMPRIVVAGCRIDPIDRSVKASDSLGCRDEFDRLEEVFPAASYQYVLYGMGFRTEVEPEALVDDASLADRARRENARQTERLRVGLPRHRDLIGKIVEHGLQPI